MPQAASRATRNATRHRAQRYRVGGMHVVYDTGDGFWSGPVIDVSESGMFVETAHELEPGRNVIIIPDVSQDDQLPLEITAKVVRVNEYDPDEHFDRTPGLAFALVGMRLEQCEQVRGFLRRRGVPVRDRRKAIRSLPEPASLAGS